MAYREHSMWEVLEVLRRAHRGEKLKAIVRSTGRSRNLRIKCDPESEVGR